MIDNDFRITIIHDEDPLGGYSKTLFEITRVSDNYYSVLCKDGGYRALSKNMYKGLVRKAEELGLKVTYKNE